MTPTPFNPDPSRSTLGLSHNGLIWLIVRFLHLCRTGFSRISIYVALMGSPIFIFPQTAPAQLHAVRLPSKPIPLKSKSGFRTQTLLPLPLPFFDDFSTNKTGLPDTLWENSASTWVNTGTGINPLTLGIVTFDGLDSLGLPYATDPLINGFTDKLVSRKIRLGDVPLNLHGSVYLSFYFQWKGNREAPDPNDYIQIELKTNTGLWEVVQIISGGGAYQNNVFYPFIANINAPRFFHNDFQFRVRSYGRLSGAFDSWHLDYFYLNANRNPNDIYYPDRAIASPLGSLFGLYRSVPLRHFRVNPTLSKPQLEVYNLQSATTTVNYRTYGTFINRDSITKTTATYNKTLSIATPLKITSNGIASHERVLTVLDTLPDPNDPLQFSPSADSIAIRLKVALRTRDNVPLNFVSPVEPDSIGDYNTRIYPPIDFRKNDTTELTYTLSHEYAYDDGEAEYLAHLTQPGNRLAYQFDLITPKPDTLVGFDIFIPDYGLTDNVVVDFYIFQDNNGLPSPFPLTLPGRTLSKKGMPTFTRINFQPALLVKNRFYIGWKEPGAGLVNVGLDKNNDTGSKIFVNINGVWLQNTDITGSLMIRPRFGSGTVNAITGLEAISPSPLASPNPNQGIFYVQGPFSQFQMFDLTGRAVSIDVMDEGFRKRIVLDPPVPGLYILHCTDGNKTGSMKVIVQ